MRAWIVDQGIAIVMQLPCDIHFQVQKNWKQCRLRKLSMKNFLIYKMLCLVDPLPSVIFLPPPHSPIYRIARNFEALIFQLTQIAKIFSQIGEIYFVKLCVLFAGVWWKKILFAENFGPLQFFSLCSIFTLLPFSFPFPSLVSCVVSRPQGQPAAVRDQQLKVVRLTTCLLMAANINHVCELLYE